ncbi:MAG: hypothetical protein PSN34_00810 [Urechidicola sp.]|nr:hypothetical protein [Urechidicola sp.]
MKKLITLLLVFTISICNSQNTYLEHQITATTSYLGQYATVKLTIDDANNDNEITHPLIVAEGFDVGVVISPENEFGLYDYNDFRGNVFKGGSDLKSLIYNTTKDYDIIYVDWSNGVDYLQRNAYALEEVINWVNSVKQGNEPNVVLGQSMGGVIARYALADMEEQGVNHDTRLFISHDAPQQGANVPVSIQFMDRHIHNLYLQISNTLLGSLVTVPIVDSFLNTDFLSLLDAPGSKQLISNFANINYTIDTTEHDAFYNELNNKGLSGSGGYPINSRNIAISNGSECGTIQDFNPGDDLVKYYEGETLSFLDGIGSMSVLTLGALAADLFGELDLIGLNTLSIIPGQSSYDVDVQAKSLSYNSGSQIYKGKVSYTKKILWFINVTVKYY